MKLAFLSFHNPVKPVNGSGARVHNLIKIMAQHHEVIVFARSDSDRAYSYGRIQVMEIKSKNDTLYPFNPSYMLKCYRFLKEKGCDIIIAEEAINILHAYVLSLLLHCKPVYDAHNIDCLNYIKIAPTRPHIWLFYFVMELLASIGFQKILFVSRLDLEQYIKLFPMRRAKLAVVPNGVDCEKFVPKSNPRKNSVLFFGSFRYRPNLEALRNVAELARKLPSINFLVAGEESDKFKLDFAHIKNLHILGKVDDITKVIQDADCVIVPLTKGSGTRIKILEAMACGKPVISTYKGAEGLNIRNSVDAIISDLESFDKHIVELVSDQKKQTMCSIAARETVLKQYDWKVIGKELNAILTDN